MAKHSPPLRGARLTWPMSNEHVIFNNWVNTYGCVDCTVINSRRFYSVFSFWWCREKWTAAFHHRKGCLLIDFPEEEKKQVLKSQCELHTIITVCTCVHLLPENDPHAFYGQDLRGIARDWHGAAQTSRPGHGPWAEEPRWVRLHVVGHFFQSDGFRLASADSGPYEVHITLPSQW